MKTATAVGLGVAVLSFALGIPLLGWGVEDWRSFFSSPIRITYAATAALQSLALCVGYLRLPFAYLPSRQRGQVAKRVERQGIVPILARLVWLAALLVSGYSDRRGLLVIEGAGWARYFGLPVYLLALGWVYWSFWTLGRQHSAGVTIQEDHVLVTSGPYRWVRHPMYLGLVLFPMGAGLVFGSLLGMALPLLVLPLFVWRIADEEKLMRKEFGERWVAYTQSTWRLLPFVY